MKNERTQNRLGTLANFSSRPSLRVVSPRNAGKPLLTRSVSESPDLSSTIDASRIFTTKEGESESNSTPPTDEGSGSGSSGSSLSDTIDSLLRYGQAGYSAYQAATNKPSTTKPPAVPGTPASYAPPPSSPAWEKYLPWGIGVMVLLVVVGLVFKRR